MQTQTGNDQEVARYVDYKSGLASVYMSIKKMCRTSTRIIVYD
jgi:hypothetical protein